MYYTVDQIKKSSPELKHDDAIIASVMSKFFKVGGEEYYKALIPIGFHCENFSALNLSEKFAEKKPLKILSLGCGFPLELIALEAYFKIKNLNVDIEFTGIDNNNKIIEFNKERFMNSKAKFYCSDASKVESLQGILTEKFDLVMLVHPYLLTLNIWSKILSTIQSYSPSIISNLIFGNSYDKDQFENMLQYTVPTYLAPAGHVYACFYYKQELDSFLKRAKNYPFCQSKSDHLFENESELKAQEHLKKQGRIMTPAGPYCYLSKDPYNPEAVPAKLENETISSATNSTNKSNKFCIATSIGAIAIAFGGYLVAKNIENKDFQP